MESGRWSTSSGNSCAKSSGVRCSTTSWDDSLEGLDAGEEVGFGEAAGAELKLAGAAVGDAPEYAANVLAQIAFKVESQIAR